MHKIVRGIIKIALGLIYAIFGSGIDSNDVLIPIYAMMVCIGAYYIIAQLNTVDGQ